MCINAPGAYGQSKARRSALPFLFRVIPKPFPNPSFEDQISLHQHPPTEIPHFRTKIHVLFLITIVVYRLGYYYIEEENIRFQF